MREARTTSGLARPTSSQPYLHLADPMPDHEPLLSVCWLEQAPGLKTRTVDAGN